MIQAFFQMPFGLTDWFSDNIAPAHVGVYERKLAYPDGPRYAKWDGKRWYASETTLEVAAASEQESGFVSGSGFDWPEWRGLAVKP